MEQLVLSDVGEKMLFWCRTKHPGDELSKLITGLRAKRHAGYVIIN